MNQQQRTEIGERIRALRIDSAETNRTIADYVGVSVDAVKGWLAGGGISYDNAEKVAELFKVDVDWLWRGDRPAATPDPFRDRYAEQLDEINRKLDEILRRLPATEPATRETEPARDDGEIQTDLHDEQDSEQAPPVESDERSQVAD